LFFQAAAVVQFRNGSVITTVNSC